MDAHVNYPNTAELNWVSLSYHSPPKSVKWQSSSLNLFELLAVCRLGFISLCKWYRLNFAFLINWTELNLLYLNNLIQLRKGFAAWCMCICEKIHMKLYVCFFFFSMYTFSHLHCSTCFCWTLKESLGEILHGAVTESGLRSVGCFKPV